MLNRIRAVCRTAARSLREDRGSALPEVMVSVIVSAVTMSVVAGAVVAVGSLNTEMVATGVAASESAYTDLRWSNDVRSAVAIAATDATAVTFTVPASGGKCNMSTWSAGTSGHGLTVTTSAYPSMSGSACTGAAAAATVEEIVASSTELSFTYRNAGGRELKFVAGAPTLVAANQPSTVSYDAWESETVGSATLRTTAAAGTGWARPIISTRSASTILGSGAGLANAAIKAVAAGDQITTNYLVDTVAGVGSAGWADGTAATAKFSGPMGITGDTDGNTFVADTANNRIRKISVSGAVTTFAGSGVDGFLDDIGPAAVFSKPGDVTVDTATGTLYVADSGNQLIRKVTADGAVSTLAGTKGVAGSVDGTGIGAKLNGPSSLMFSGGSIYFTDTTGNQIRKVTAAGVVTTVAGSGVAGFADGTGAAAVFNGPEGIDVDAAGNIYVADSANNRIRKVTAAGVVTTVAGATAGMVDGATAAARFSAPKGVTVDAAGNLYVADSANWRIRMISAAGVVSTVAGKAVSGSLDAVGATATFGLPYDVEVSPAPGGRVLIADRGSNKIRVLQ